MDKYLFTRFQLHKLLAETVQLAHEYKHKHGRDWPQAAQAAALDTLEGLDAELDLFLAGECDLSCQLILEDPAQDGSPDRLFDKEKIIKSIVKLDQPDFVLVIPKMEDENGA